MLQLKSKQDNSIDHRLSQVFSTGAYILHYNILHSCYVFYYSLHTYIRTDYQSITTIESCRCHIAPPATQRQLFAYGIFYIYAVQSYPTALRLSGKFSRGPFIHSLLTPCAKRAFFIDADPPGDAHMFLRSEMRCFLAVGLLTALAALSIAQPPCKLCGS